MPRIYVACLASYNNGVLHGVWIDCEGKSGDDIQEEVNAMLRASRFPNVEVLCPVCDGKGCDSCSGDGNVPSAEEWAIHDHEGFGSLIEESTSFDRVAELAELIEEHGDAFIAYAENMGGDVTERQFQDAYIGKYDSVSEWAQEWGEECGLLDSMPEELRMYFDWDSYARDLELNGDVNLVDGYLFRNL